MGIKFRRQTQEERWMPSGSFKCGSVSDEGGNDGGFHVECFVRYVMSIRSDNSFKPPMPMQTNFESGRPWIEARVFVFVSV